MANRRTTSRPFRAGRRQPTTWSRTTSVGSLTVPAASKVLLTTFTLANPGIGETVRRTRGLISISSDQTAAVEEQTGALGFVVVTDLAIAAGAASIPGPHTDSSDDGWFVWLPFMQTSIATLATANLISYQYDFDSKAMRKVQEGSGVAVMVENSNAATGLKVLIGVAMLTSLS